MKPETAAPAGPGGPGGPGGPLAIPLSEKDNNGIWKFGKPGCVFLKLGVVSVTTVHDVEEMHGYFIHAVGS